MNDTKYRTQQGKMTLMDEVVIFAQNSFIQLKVHNDTNEYAKHCCTGNQSMSFVGENVQFQLFAVHSKRNFPKHFNEILFRLVILLSNRNSEFFAWKLCVFILSKFTHT